MTHPLLLSASRLLAEGQVELALKKIAAWHEAQQRKKDVRRVVRRGRCPE